MLIYSDLVRKAFKIAYKAHEGQVDKAGMPYILHPIEVAEQMGSEYEQCVALLHDVVEDTDVSFEDLEKEFPAKIVEGVRYLTRPEDMSYMDYVRRAKSHPIARKVKMADLRHNMREDRLLVITDKDKARIKKYKKALKVLEQEGE